MSHLTSGGNELKKYPSIFDPAGPILRGTNIEMTNKMISRRRLYKESEEEEEIWEFTKCLDNVNIIRLM